MGVFHVFKIVQMLPNRSTHHIYACVKGLFKTSQTVLALNKQQILKMLSINGTIKSPYGVHLKILS